ncbi:MAG: ATPase [Alphaproteobacteria bacterium]|nr:ATPase [Alphaproteobacteria bacterium]MBM3601443.1 ATPase [Alphaproteobacteria bacterium]
MLDLNDAPHPSSRQVRYDLDAIVARLRATAESWVPHQFPNGRRVGDEWRLANIKGAAPRKQGSCVIALKGEHAGDWIDFDGGHGGGPLSALEEATGLKGRDLFAHAAEMVGWLPGAPSRQEPQAAAAKPERDTAREIAFIMERAVPLADTPAAYYLRGRGLAFDGVADLLAHHDLTHWETKSGFPGMIAVVRDVDGESFAIHRTYLQVAADAPDTVTKAAVSKPRMMLGRVAGGAVRLAPISDAAIVLGLCEGIETGLAVMTSCPGLPVWATLSATNLEQVKLPPEAHRIVILADHDASGAGARAAETAARRLRAEGRQVAIALPTRPGDDFNDVLLRDGPEAVAAIVQAALTAKDDKDEALTPDATGRHLPVGFVAPAETLPALRADDGDLSRAVDRAWSLLLQSNRSPWIFRSGGLPTWIVPDDEGRPVAVTITDERLRHMLAKLAVWRRMGRSGDVVPAHPPTAVIKSILATPDPGLPVLSGIVTTPVFGRGGTLLTESGYHPDARLFYRPTPGFTVPTIPDCPTANDITQARSLLLDDLLGDFPFTSLAERAHAVSLLLLGFLRAMVDGPTPLHLIEKPAPGTGATLMVDAIATILTGSGASVMTEASDDEEWRKRVTAKLRQIPALLLIDNIHHKLDSSALAAALTAPFWEDRILGVSEMTRLPIRCIWIVTGNNPEFSNEMARRLVRIRLDARVDQPWRREGFRHPDLMIWVRTNRARLVAACLILCRAWIAAGRPQGTRSIGSYESWAQTLGGVLEVAGIDGFLGNLDEMMEASDGEGAVWRSFVSAWWDRFGTAEVSTSDLYELAQVSEPPLPLGFGNDRSQRIRLGKALGRMRDRMFRLRQAVVRIEASGTYQGAQRWRLVLDEKTGTDEHSQHSPKPAEPVNVVNVGECSYSNIHEPKPMERLVSGQSGECRECFSNPYTCADARAPVKETTGKHSPHSRHSPDPGNSRVSDGEYPGECQGGHSPIPNPPAWLEDVP